MNLRQFREMTEQLPDSTELLVDISDEEAEKTTHAYFVHRIEVTAALHINGLMTPTSVNLQVST